VLAGAAARETVIVAEIDRDYQDRVRRELPCLTHVRSFLVGPRDGG
jgi:predicted amidohydrolase